MFRRQVNLGDEPLGLVFKFEGRIYRLCQYHATAREGEPFRLSFELRTLYPGELIPWWKRLEMWFRERWPRVRFWLRRRHWIF
jgi:hypothetical protein